MKRITAVLLGITFIASGFLLYGQGNEGGFYQASASAEGANQEAAFRQAKAKAIDSLFGTMGKDPFFKEYYITSKPETIQGEITGTETRDNGTVRVTARVRIDKTDVALSEQAYYVAVLGVLNSAESILRQAEEALSKAKRAEENLELPEAYVSFVHASEEAERAMGLLLPVETGAVVSDGGSSVSVLKERTTSVAGAAGDGIGRISSLEEKNRKDSAVGDTYEMLKSEMESLESFVLEHQEMRPFYDLEKGELEALLVDVKNKADLAGKDLKKSYQELLQALAEDQEFLQKRIEMDMVQLENREKQLDQMVKELRLEIRNPRLQRQEAAQKRAERARALGKALGWLFTHEPSEILSLRLSPGLAVKHEGGFTQVPLRFNLGIEYGTGGIWFHTRFFRDALSLLGPDGAEGIHHSMHQLADIGFYRNSLFSLGFLWTWKSSFKDSSGTETALNPSYGVRLALGKMQSREDVLGSAISYTYYIPSAMEEFDALEIFNGMVQFQLRMARFLVLEAEAFSRVHPTAEAEANEASHRIGWSAGLGIRLPSPFTWGVQFRQEWQSKKTGGEWGETVTIPGMWSIFLGYTF